MDAENVETQSIAGSDLDLIDPSLEDEGKTAEEIWRELDEEEGEPAEGSEQDDPPREDSVPEDSDTDSATETGTDQPDSSERRTADDSAQSAGEPTDKGAADKAAADIEKLLASAPAEVRAAWAEQQAEIKRLQQSDRSNRGRIAALQRQRDELLARERERQASAGPQQGAVKGSPAAQDPALEDDPEVKALVEEYPEIAQPILKIMKRVVGRIAQIDEKEAKAAKQEHENFVAQQVQLLESHHADWQEVTAGPDFADWLQSQPRYVREAVLRNANEIVDAEEAADVIGRFKAFRSSQGQGAAQGDTPFSGASHGQGNGSTGSLSGRRRRQLESSTAARGRGLGPMPDIPQDGDPEAIWQAFDELERRAGVQV